MTELSADTDFTLMASAEIMQLDDLSAGDPTCREYVNFIQGHIGIVTRQTQFGKSEHERLISDNMSNPVGVAQKLSELPGLMDTATSGSLLNAETGIDVLALRLQMLALTYDSVNDATLRDELHLLTAHSKPNDGTLITAAQNARYASIMASPFGQALCQNQSQDFDTILKWALKTNGESGTPLQRRAVAALARIPAAKRAHLLAQQGARDASQKIRARHAHVDRGYNGPTSPDAIRSAAKAKAFG
jgi:hypothetical protein